MPQREEISRGRGWQRVTNAAVEYTRGDMLLVAHAANAVDAIAEYRRHKTRCHPDGPPASGHEWHGHPHCDPRRVSPGATHYVDHLGQRWRDPARAPGRSFRI